MSSNVAASGALYQFLRDPGNFLVSEQDLDYIQNGQYYEISHLLSLQIFVGSSGICDVQGYYDGQFVITSFVVRPEGYGFGRICLKFLSNKLAEKNISLTVTDELDEAKIFWDKMYAEGIIV